MRFSDQLMNKQKIHIKFNIYIVITHIDVVCQEANSHAVLATPCAAVEECDQYSGHSVALHVLKHDKYALI